jgi:hypothetical protein
VFADCAVEELREGGLLVKLDGGEDGGEGGRASVFRSVMKFQKKLTRLNGLSRSSSCDMAADREV